MFYQSRGALHMHTTHSDGTGTLPELVQAAKEAGLAWIWVTDHDTMAAKPSEGIIDGVTTLIGYEITPQRNHYLVGDVDELVSRELSPANYVAEVAQRGGVGIVAHPDEKAYNRYKEPYRWDDWSIRGFTGIELWNYMSDWAEHATPVYKYRNYFFPSFALEGPTPDTLRWWDKLQLEGEQVTGVFGVDAHAHKTKQVGKTWTVFPYVHCFRQLVNYLQLNAPLSKEFKEAEQQIWNAIRRGRVIMANQSNGDATGTTYLAHIRDQIAFYTCGDTVPLVDGLIIDFSCPQPADLRLFRNGELLSETRQSQRLRYPCYKAGHYRVEAHRRPKTGGGTSLWIMTNHIHVV